AAGGAALGRVIRAAGGAGVEVAQVIQDRCPLTRVAQFVGEAQRVVQQNFGIGGGWGAASVGGRAVVVVPPLLAGGRAPGAAAAVSSRAVGLPPPTDAHPAQSVKTRSTNRRK